MTFYPIRLYLRCLTNPAFDHDSVRPVPCCLLGRFHSEALTHFEVIARAGSEEKRVGNEILLSHDMAIRRFWRYESKGSPERRSRIPQHRPPIYFRENALNHISNQWHTDSLITHAIFYFLQCRSRGANKNGRFNSVLYGRTQFSA
jgi:hypothetical protein